MLTLGNWTCSNEFWPNRALLSCCCRGLRNVSSDLEVPRQFPATENPLCERGEEVLVIPYRNSGRYYCPKWPEEVAKSAFNMPKWESLISRFKIGDDSQEVLEGCKNGFHQGIPQHTMGSRKWFTPKNHESAKLAEEKIRYTLEKERRASRISGPFTHKEVYKKLGFFRSSPMGSVINGDGSFRIINDLSYPHDDLETPSVNSFVDKKEFKTNWDDFKVVIMFFKKNKGDLILALFDWEKTYRQIATHPSQWRYLFILDLYNRLWMDTRVQFGGVAGCGVFGRPADLWRKIVVKAFKLECGFRWVDDNLLVKERSNPTSIADIVRLSDEMGVASNPEKVHDFEEEQRYIGFIWNSRERTVRLPDGKLQERLKQVVDFLVPQGSFYLKDVEKLTGRLVHTAYIVPHLQCYMTSLWRWKKQWQVPSAKRKIPEDVREDLTEWNNTLSTFDCRRIIPDVTPIDLEWVGDASLIGIGVLIGEKWAQFSLSEGWNLPVEGEVKKNIAWAKTVAIRLGMIMIAQFHEVGGKRFVVLTDNTTSQSAVDKRRSGDQAVNGEWKAIQKLLMSLHSDLVAIRVKSDDNLADKLSRGLEKRDVVDQVVIEIPIDLRSVVKQVIM